MPVTRSSCTGESKECERTSDTLFDMLESISEEPLDVSVIQSIIDGLACLPTAHQTELPKHPERMGYGGLAHPQGSGEVTHTEFLLRQGSNQPESVGVSQSPERFREEDDHLCGLHLVSGPPNLREIGDLYFAEVVVRSVRGHEVMSFM
jgi:hypothetical protein